MSRILAHEASFDNSTSTPYLANKPNSLAATSGAQSVSGMNPNLIFLPTGFVGLVVPAEAANANAITQHNDKIDFNSDFVFITVNLFWNTPIRPPSKYLENSG